MRKLRKIIIFVLIAVVIYNGVPSMLKKVYPMKHSQLIYNYAKKYDLDPYFVAAVIKTESNFNSNAVSCKNAYGLMQITSSTGIWIAEQMKLKDFQVDKLFQPEYNISMGCWYLDDLKKEFGGNMDLVLAAYNGGRGNVQKWLSETEHSKDGKNLHYIPFKETDKYVKKVKVSYNIYRFLYSK
ncbi:lytic transglycosylase domain-containing protein [Clostridium lundense]|uniref:lytic transglycosylase domain-containing protein n=1 Tax=Clostridium lundense TaxID=319475 RepID=UPI0004806168|nr:lytic transglycosylase domain-containing protein [Clostridium lundense]